MYEKGSWGLRASGKVREEGSDGGGQPELKRGGRILNSMTHKTIAALQACDSVCQH